MADSRPEAFRFTKLRAAPSPEHFALHIAALEWSLDAPITIRGEADIQSRKHWDGRFEPFAHQIRNLITFCRRAPVALLADDVGLGKTISAGLILSELMVRKKVSRALIVAPKLILPQWQEELAVKFGIPATTATGAELAAAIRRETPVVISTYHSIRTHLDSLRWANFDMLILDEAHKLRNLHGTAQPPQFAVRVRQALADRVFKYVLMLTATPIQNRLWDLYSLIDLLTIAKGHTNPLGSPESFRNRYIEGTRAVQIQYGRRDEFRQHLSNYIVRTRRSDAKLAFPTRRVRTHRVAATPVELNLLQLVGDLFREGSLNGLAQSSIGQALMSSPQALASQLEEMGNRGTVPSNLADRVRRLVSPDTVSGKLAGLTTLIQELASERPQDWRLVVFTSRTKTLEAIGRHLLSQKIPTGFIAGSRGAENEKAVRAFWESPPGIRVIVSTDAGAEGINLQVANVLVNFDLPWNPMVLEQRIGRIQRLASKHAEITVLNLVLAGSVEERVVARLSEKLQAISESLGDIEGILESAAHAGDDDESFETMIRNLVVNSLKGVDVEQATRLAMESIEEAKEIYESERETVEKTLGDLKDLHRAGPRVPEITPVTPSVEARDFVLRTLKQDGAQIRPIDGDLHSVYMPGKNAFRITFKDRQVDGYDDNGIFGGNAPRLYAPGKRDFERLAQSWTEKAGALIVDRSNPTDQEIERLLGEWLGRLEGFDLADFEINGRKVGFVGELTFRASVAVSHDRLEKLVTVPIRNGVVRDIEVPAEAEPPSREECDPAQLAGDLRSVVAAAIKSEPDLTKFSVFYEKRLEEELEAAADAERQRRLREQFTPASAADAVAARGVRYAVIDVTARIHIDSQGPYPASFSLLQGGASGACVEATSEWITCQITGKIVPNGATDSCSLSGQRVLRHLMSPSSVSGRCALTDLMVRCEATGELVFPDESELCAITGRRVRIGLLAKSAVSGRSALPSELVKCQITGSDVLPEELVESAVSGLKFRSDQKAVSSLSGRVGHVSEVVPSVLPEGLLARDEAEQSSVSGAWGDAKRMIRSERPPGRLGLPSEQVRCEVSGRTVLCDEVGRSEVSGRSALPEEMANCEFTGAKCFPTELLISAVSNKRYRHDERVCSLHSGRAGHRSEFVDSVDPPGPLVIDEAERSDVSGRWAQRDRLARSEVPPHRWALPDEMATSSVTGKRVLPDEVVFSALSDKAALSDEMATCEFTGDPVLPDELAVSELSGKKFRIDQMVMSQLDGRRGHSSEFVDSVLPKGPIAGDEAGKSDVSGKIAAKVRLVASEAPPHRWGLPDEIVVSAVSGKRFLLDEVARSQLSASWALPSELEKCDFTGALVLPREIEISDFSGKKLRKDQLVRSVLSNRHGHSSEFVPSVAPTGWIGRNEAEQSALSGEWGAATLLVSSERPPHRRGLAHEMAVCELTKRRLLRDEVAASSVSGRVIDISLLVASAASGKKAAAEEMIICESTGRRLLPDEVSTCAITGKRVDLRELARSEVSGKRGLVSLMKSCTESGKRVLPAEAIQCAISGQPVLPLETRVCVVTNRRARKSLMRKCPTSGSDYIEDAESRARIVEITGAEELIRPCQWTGRQLLATLIGKCAITGLRVEKAELNQAGEIAVLRRLLDGLPVEGSQPLVGDSLEWLRSTRQELRHAQEAYAVRSTNRRSVIAVVRAKAGLLRLSNLHYAIVANVGKAPSLLCEPIPGKRTAQGWLRISS